MGGWLVLTIKTPEAFGLGGFESLQDQASSEKVVAANVLDAAFVRTRLNVVEVLRKHQGSAFTA